MKKRKSQKKPPTFRQELQQALFPEKPITRYKAPPILTTTLAGNRMRDAEGVLLNQGTHQQILNKQGRQETVKLKVTSAPKKERLSITSCLAKKLKMRREYFAFKSTGRGSRNRPHLGRFTVEC